MRKTVLHRKKLLSKSPFGDSYPFCANIDDRDKIKKFIKQNKGRKVAVVQGLGFVGSAMLTAVAGAKAKKDGHRLYAVIGVDLPMKSSYWKIGMVNDGKLPLKSADYYLNNVFEEAFKSGNITATADTYAYTIADIILVNVNFDIKKHEKIDRKNRVSLNKLVSAMREIARKIHPSCLIIVESTLPPGTCESVLLPLFRNEFKKRGFDDSGIKLAYSYERVMPGKNYLKSITSYYRVYSGINNGTKREAKAFLESIIDTASYPLTELSDITAAEVGKVLENSYRATNIAFIQEWTELAESTGVNLFEVIKAIRKRDTHKNIMLPGFGVGGYCLTKDPILAEWGNAEIFNSVNPLNMTLNAVSINEKMPLHSFSLLRKYLEDISNKRILLMGVSYREDIADTRFSPSEFFYKRCIDCGAVVIPHDPIVEYWVELDLEIAKDLHQIEPEKVDAIVFAVKHDEYVHMKPERYARLLKRGGFILDCNDIITEDNARSLRDMGFKLAGVGKGHWNRLLKR